MQRKLQFHLIHANNEFTLAIVEVVREQMRNPNMDPMIFYLFNRTSSISDYITSHISHFNALDRVREINIEDYLVGENVHETIADRMNRDSQFAVRVFHLMLPANIKELLPLLGSLDGGIHAMAFHNEGTFIDYLEGAPRLDDLSRLCQTAMAKKDNAVDFSKQPLSREIAQWMCANIEDKQHELVVKLSELLALDGRSLTPAIRQFLYPRKSAEEMLAERCVGADELIKELLNPGISFVKKDANLVQFIRDKLKQITKPDVENPVTAATVHGEISEWFKGLTAFQKEMWKAKIETVVGLLAVDGGFYTNNYTEVQLLQQATIVFNNHGLAELRFLHTHSYRRNYAEGQRLHDILYKELSQICHDLDLHFLPNQNFHVAAVFDADSSRALRNAGFHYTEYHCKEMMRNEQLMKTFRFSATVGDRHDMQILNPHKPLQHMILGWANLFERNEKLWEKEKSSKNPISETLAGRMRVEAE